MYFKNATHAFEYFFDFILTNGVTQGNTKAIRNIGFTILNPLDNKITTPWRKWKLSYAETEWKWYLSKSRDVSEIKKIAKIWDSMHSGDNIVNSNYGYQWSRNDQLQYVIDTLKKDPNSRRAFLTIYDGKEHSEYLYDTPCTLNIGFDIFANKLNMSVLMRSNDLVYGFCNDQYCFSKLQELVALELSLKVGEYFHFANNLHIYDKHFNLKYGK